MNDPTSARRPGEAGVKKNTRPSWMTRPCPSWCEWNGEGAGSHSEQDHYDDRVHSGGQPLPVILTAVEDPGGTGDGEPAEARMFLRQHYREAGPRIEVSRDDRVTGLQFTLDEGELFAVRLLETVAAGREDEDVPVPVEGCPAWCREHHEGGHLATVESGPARVCVSQLPGGQPDVTVDIPSDAVMSVGEAEDLARTLLELAVAARR